MTPLTLRPLHEALTRKADSVQREFITVSERLRAIEQEMPRVPLEEQAQLRAEQQTLYDRQQSLADEINSWRDWARAIGQPRGEAPLREAIDALLKIADEALRPVVERTLYLIDHPEEAEELAQARAAAKPQTPAGRLLERARTDWDIRNGGPAERKRAAVEFANRSGVAQDDAIVREIEAAMEDEDEIVREVAALTAIQLHRFRALRSADIIAAHESTLCLSRLAHPAAVPVLAEILEHPHPALTQEESAHERKARLAALARLIEWHTAEAQTAVIKRQFDQDPAIAHVAARALELFSGEWKGPLTGSSLAGALMQKQGAKP